MAYEGERTSTLIILLFQKLKKNSRFANSLSVLAMSGLNTIKFSIIPYTER